MCRADDQVAKRLETRAGIITAAASAMGQGGALLFVARLRCSDRRQVARTAHCARDCLRMISFGKLPAERSRLLQWSRMDRDTENLQRCGSGSDHGTLRHLKGRT